LGGAVPATLNIIQVTATSGGQTATFDQVFPVSSFTGEYLWSLPSPVTLGDGTTSLGTIDKLEVTLNADPQVDLEFAITNTSLTNPISYDIATATILFDPIANAEAAALASVTLTQGAGSPDGASIAGLLDGKLYQARYSTDGINNTKTVFSSLVSGFSFASGLSMDGSEGAPASGMTPLSSTVYMMESEFKFILSAGDQASGTSAFLITPEPASLAIMGLASLLLVRGRRH
jgi:hypothetical protein